MIVSWKGRPRQGHPAGKEGLAAATECALDFLRPELGLEAQSQQTEIKHEIMK
jgi:hypothetical protein